MLHCIPDFLPVNAKILVHEDISHCDYVVPRYLRTGCTDLLT